MTPRQIAMLLGLAALWGASFLFMRVAVPALGPIVLADGRVAIAGVALLAYAAAIRARSALRERWRDYLLLGAINAALPFSLLAAAELEIEASLAAVLNAVAPMCGAIVGAVWLRQPVTRAAMVGLVLGVAGVALVVGLSPFTIDLPFVLAVLACLGAAFAYGVGANLVRERFTGDPPLAMAVGQQLAAALALLPLVPFVPLRATPDAVDLACLLGLGLGSTGVAYLLYFRLLAELGPRRHDRDLRRARVRRAVGRAVPRRGDPLLDARRRRRDLVQRVPDHAWATAEQGCAPADRRGHLLVAMMPDSWEHMFVRRSDGTATIAQRQLAGGLV
jgi:drug/metabolite transporter (DMT)-like permease